jgi:hypothetical protein
VAQAGFNVLPPTGAPGTPAAPGTRNFQRITGASATASSTTLRSAQWHTLMVSMTTSVRVRFSPKGSIAAATATDLQLPAGGRFDWVTTTDSDAVSILPDAGTFEAYLWESEGAL